MPEPENLVLSLLRELRSDMQTQSSVTNKLIDMTRRIERRMDAVDEQLAHMGERIARINTRIGDQHDELELLVKGELMGALTHNNVQNENAIHTMEDFLNTVVSEVKELSERVEKIEKA
jgi:archaellum component FlaC